MVFSSQLFLYAFIPVFFSLYFLISDRYKNWLILVASLTFYAVGAGSTVLVLIVSIWVNQFLAVRMAPAPPRRRKALLMVGVVVNLLGLAYYKYGTFVWTLSGEAADLLGFQPLPAAPLIPLPVGISFFTFQAVSYLIDVYRGEIRPARGYGEFATYHSLFPQLVAGPIVRYREIQSEMLTRRIDRVALTEGAYRFCLGLGKKIVIADNLAIVADAMFKLPAHELGVAQAWLGILCYSLQIYFDFSGYSDMAIGLGRLLGFHFPENFDQPYRSANVTEFWRRWHMTLSRWLRDYLYIPLGGNRVSSAMIYRNLFVTFLLGGLWHGAAWTFVIWGALHGAACCIHRGWSSAGFRMPKPVAVILTFLFVNMTWVYFRAPDVATANALLLAMATPDFAAPVLIFAAWPLLLIGAAIVWFCPNSQTIAAMDWNGRAALSGTLAGAAAIVALIATNTSALSPFIYFNF
jgi:alginate O-acetyltransferase complex protein AlgI